MSIAVSSFLLAIMAIYLYVCTCIRACHVHMWRSLLSSHTIIPVDQNQVIRLSSKSPSPMSHLTGPIA